MIKSLKNTSLKIVFVLFLMSSTQQIYSQDVKEAPTKPQTDSVQKKEKRLKFGCGFGLNFVGGTNINLSPNLTYKVNEKIAFSAGIQGSYAALKNIQNTTTYGASFSAIYLPIKQIQTSIEFVQLRVQTTNKTAPIEVTKSFWDSALFAGIGYNITKKISVGAKYNFLYKENESVYTSAVIPFVNITF